MRDHLWGLICVRRARRDTISGERRMPRCSDGPTPGCLGGNYPWVPGRILPSGTQVLYGKLLLDTQEKPIPLGTQEEPAPIYILLGKERQGSRVITG